MKKYNKKIALILALSIVLALGIPALAAQTEINGSYMDAASHEIHVLVTGQVNAFLNPNKYPVDVYGNGADAELVGTLNAGQVVTRPIVGVNLGNGSVSVKASVNSALKGKFKFATSAPKDTAKTINGYVYLEAAQPTTTLGFDSDNDFSSSAYGKFDGSAVVNAMNATKWKENVDKKTPGVVILKKGTVAGKDELVTLKPAVDGEPVAESYFLARLTGTLGKGDPEKADKGKAWSQTDGFDAIITWSFSTASASTPPPPPLPLLLKLS